MQRTFDSGAAKAIADAVRDVESRSAAEVVVEIRTRSGSYAIADARFAALLAIISLVVLVFMPFTVLPSVVILDPIAVYLAGIAVARRSASLRRLCSTRAERLEAVRVHAAAKFHERGVANTSAETGLLLYASLLERRIEVLADRGLLQRLVPHEWNALLDDIRTERAIDPDLIVTSIRSLAAILGRDVPRGEHDVNELLDMPEIGA
jgi:putative membrane protein